MNYCPHCGTSLTAAGMTWEEIQKAPPAKLAKHFAPLLRDIDRNYPVHIDPRHRQVKPLIDVPGPEGWGRLHQLQDLLIKKGLIEQREGEHASWLKVAPAWSNNTPSGHITFTPPKTFAFDQFTRKMDGLGFSQRDGGFVPEFRNGTAGNPVRIHVPEIVNKSPQFKALTKEMKLKKVS